MNENITTDSWPLSKILKHILLPKPKDAPRAGTKEKVIRGMFFLIALGFAYHQFTNGKEIPTCDANETNSLVEKIINDLPAAKSVGAKFVSLKDINEKGYNKKSEIRACEAVLITTKGEDSLLYSIKWQDKSSKIIWIEAEIQSASSDAGN